ncbi:MAG: single-stranded DNA exonuclease RecJ [Dethiosulfovibrio peptidovorans]|nr:MAG: single-stranded DNA exonuclease RecJ [Dethiosulfovibrio peptidovorans]
MLPTCSSRQIQRLSVDDDPLALSTHLGCSNLLATVMRSRWGDDPDKLSSLLVDDLPGSLQNLDLGPDVDRALELWNKAVPNQKVLVYGDYDVDGVSSSALAIELAGLSGASSVSYYLPHRQNEGYGVHRWVIQAAVVKGFQTLIVVDCGSKDVEAIDQAVRSGMTVIVFDHHSVDGDVIAIPGFVNPQRGGCAEACRLCATAVLWAWAFRCAVAPREWLFDRLDLVALATVADCMPLGPLNRALVGQGLDVLRNRPRPGLLELCQRLSVSPAILDEETLSMKLVPCLNAAGRLDVADRALDVVLGNGDVAHLYELNQHRKEISATITSTIVQKIERSMMQVHYDESWPVGVLSAVASRLCYGYDRAFALAAPSGNGIRGTLRVPEGGNAVQILSDLDNLLEGWGGHQYAAGFSVTPDRWDLLTIELDRRLKAIISPEKVDVVIDWDPSRFDMGLWHDLRRIGPFGHSHPFPAFFVPRRGGERLQPLGKGGLHGKIDVGSGTLLAFNGARQHCSMEDIYGWVYRPRLNEWKGRLSLQFVVEKIVLADGA